MTSLLRLNQSVVSIIALVEDSESLGVSVAENEKLVRLARQTQCCLFSSDWFHGVATCRNDSRRTRRRFEVAVGLRRHSPGGFCTLRAVDDLLFEFDCLLLDLRHRACERHVHVGVRVFRRQRVVAPGNYNLSNLTVLLNIDNYMSA